jgi:saccharopine dehydrogenase-like NADP-dependent oxidoreductase
VPSNLPKLSLQIGGMTMATCPHAGHIGRLETAFCEAYRVKKVAVIGGGKIGSMIVDLLSHSGDYEVTVADRSREQLDRLETSATVERVPLDITDSAGLERLLAGKFAVLSAAPFHLTTRIAEAAKARGAHYLDLTEDVASTRFV